MDVCGSEWGEVVPASGRIPGPDEAAHLENRLMSELSSVNYRLGEYVLRYLDADAARVEPMPIADEFALADCLSAAADAVRMRAKRRELKDSAQ